MVGQMRLYILTGRIKDYDYRQTTIIASGIVKFTHQQYNPITTRRVLLPLPFMTKEQFQQYWTSNYGETPPISHFFRHDYPDRWFRIHSLPESQRYAGNAEDWQILLNRQNTIITDITSNNPDIIIVTGGYHHDDSLELKPIEEIDSVMQLPLINLNRIDLHQLDPHQYDQGQWYIPMFCTSVWQTDKFNDILKDIADDYMRAFFISPHNNALIAPYDGGMDIILKDIRTRDHYKNKYHNWLSAREDGL